MTVTIYSTPLETTRWIGSFRFLFELHTVQQQVQLDALRAAADVLTPAQIGNPDPEAVDANGIPLAALRIIRLGYQQMERLGNKIDVLSQNADVFFAAASALGLYGQTSQEITAEILRIKSDTPPNA